LREWCEKRSGAHEVEHVLSLDLDDPTDYQYVQQGYSGQQVTFQEVMSFNPGCVAAFNRAARIATGDVLIGLCDDAGCPQNWDTEILKAIERAGKKVTDPWLLHVADGIQEEIATLFILSRAHYEQVGPDMCYPEYISVYVDNDATERAKAMGVYVKDFSLMFEHRHWSVGKAVRDETYRREGRQSSRLLGAAIFEKRKACNFGVPICTR
jgi:glycosyltransferase involved in cell wall biosynthesis